MIPSVNALCARDVSSATGGITASPAAITAYTCCARLLIAARALRKIMNPWIAMSVTVAVIAAVVLASIYNRLVGLNNHCQNSFAQIEVQLKRRSDLIPNLVECVRGYMSHERETLERVIAARNQAAEGLRQVAQQPENRNAVENWLGAEGNLGRALRGLWMAMENYPELKASRSAADLTEQLTSTENRIAFARQAHNDWVTAFNSYRQTFPQCSLAGPFGFTQNRKLLEFADAEKLTPAPSVVLS
jgi:LemA protein